MDNTTTENKKRFLQNDPLLVCSMLLFYGLCGIGLASAAFWWLNQRDQAISVNATSTAYAIGTQQTQGTATAAARATEQGQYKFIDRFDTYSTSAHWTYGPQNNDYWEGSVLIKDGAYTWEVNQVKKTFVWWTDFAHEFQIKDFDAYLDVKFVEGSRGDVCGGFVFRKSSKGWDHGAFIFTICNDSSFKVEYHGENGWEYVSNREDNHAIRPADWNRIEIAARSSHFIFTINNEAVYELTDARQPEGSLAIITDVRTKDPAVVWFDNFAYQIP
jgi:3-keto-disaccharide hydrolase